VRATEVFVLEHRALSMYFARGGADFPGARVNPNPLYRVPLSPPDSHCLAGAGVGNAQTALELTIEAHIGFSWDAQGAPWGLVALGGEFSSPTM